MLNTREQRFAVSSFTSAGMPSTAYASTPRRTSASRQLRPESSDTSRSEEVPPMSTATRPKSPGLMTLLLLPTLHLAHDPHFGTQLHSLRALDGAAYVLDQLLDIRRTRGTVVDDEVRVHLG